MKRPMPSPRLIVAGILAGLVFVSPALSSRESLDEPLAPRAGVAVKPRPVRPAPRVAQAETPCPKVRRSLFVEGEGWIVRRVCR